MPVLFVSHGAPTLALDAVRGADLRRLAAALPRPRAILALSAHWLDAPATIGTVTAQPLLYDFAGFPEPLYHLRYPAPPAADLGRELLARLPQLRHDPTRPWDHGVYVPLLHMYPDADVPVLELSLPHRAPVTDWFALGHQLAFLRDQGVLVLGSGGAVHNLRRLDWQGSAAPPAWATGFEQWLRERIEAGAIDDLLAFRERAPAVRIAHPTDEHLAPLLVALGAASAGGIAGTAQFPITGFEYGSLSRLAVLWP